MKEEKEYWKNRCELLLKCIELSAVANGNKEELELAKNEYTKFIESNK